MSEQTKVQPSFRVHYEKLDSPVRLMQELRSDVKFDDDALNNFVWMIWPKFECEIDSPIEEGIEAAPVGTAVMLILNQNPDYRAMLRTRLKIGATGYFVGGSMKIAKFEITELLGDEAKAK
ncbi:MAG: hypothetical protein HYS18_02065 [Burkholderiales bacterium]|nr:hypothetical protein [Burkholderiales bacterium]